MSKYSSSSGAHDDEDDDEDDDEGFSGEEEEEEGKASAPMMSLFASYYGIEASAPSEASSARGTIDDHNFNADDYCRVGQYRVICYSFSPYKKYMATD